MTHPVSLSHTFAGQCRRAGPLFVVAIGVGVVSAALETHRRRARPEVRQFSVETADHGLVRFRLELRHAARVQWCAPNVLLVGPHEGHQFEGMWCAGAAGAPALRLLVDDRMLEVYVEPPRVVPVP